MTLTQGERHSTVEQRDGVLLVTLNRPDRKNAPSLRMIGELKAARATVGTMNTMYSIAAILVVLFGGMLIDRLGTRKASIIFSALVFAGAAIVWQAKSIPLISSAGSSSAQAPNPWSSPRAPCWPAGSRTSRWPWPSASS